MKTKCRVKHCRGNTKKSNHLYTCKICKAAFFHSTYKYGRNGLKDFNNDEILNEELLKSNIRPNQNLATLCLFNSSILVAWR